MMKRFINALIGLYNRTHTGSKLEIIEDVSEFFVDFQADLEALEESFPFSDEDLII